MANEHPVEYEDPDVSGLHIELFESDSNLIGVSAVKLGSMNGRDEMQLLTNIEQEFQSAVNQWVHYAALGGAGQYSLERDTPAGVIAFLSRHNRNPNKNEINWDVDEFRAGKEYAKNVVGKPTTVASPEDKYKPIVIVGDKTHLYEGPQRLWQVSFITRAYNGAVPESMTEFAKEMEAYKNRMGEFIDTGSQVVLAGYIIFHAEEGDIMYKTFASPEAYNEKEFAPAGVLQASGRMMFYIPEASPTRINLSELRLRD